MAARLQSDQNKEIRVKLELIFQLYALQ